MASAAIARLPRSVHMSRGCAGGRQAVRFEGYRRENGTVGVRNHVLVFPTVVCSASVAQRISGGVPGTISVSHPHGCGHLGADREHMVRTMAGFCSNPNVAGVLLVGLGCEELTVETLAAELESRGLRRVEALTIQEEGGTPPAFAKGCELASRLVRAAEADRREPFDVSELVVGVKCGGSDALSGLTANPPVGAASDRLVSEGATVIMTEVPEMIGAEHLLERRAADETVRTRIREVGPLRRPSRHWGGMSGDRPSRATWRGLTTLEEKSWALSSRRHVGRRAR